MRRLLLAAFALVTLAAPFAVAQTNGYTGGWTDPAPSATRDDKPLTYLEDAKAITGEVSHPNGIGDVSAVIVPDPDSPPPAGCDPTMEPVTAEPNGTSVTFHVNATFPCNIVYELRATAQANTGSGVGASPPPAFQMPLFVAAAIPPAPVGDVDAILEVSGSKRKITLQWAAGSEPDLLGYVVTRTTSGETKTLGQVDAGDDTTLVDDDPPAGKTSRYDVTAVRRGPDDEHKQIAATPTAVRVDVPAQSASTGGDGSGSGDSGEPPLTTIVTSETHQGAPNPGLLSSVNAAGSHGGPPSPPTTLDTGFNPTLSYPTPADEAAAAPTGDPAVVVTFDEGGADTPWENRETMTFVAGGLALLVGALIVSHITRRAAREAW